MPVKNYQVLVAMGEGEPNKRFDVKAENGRVAEEMVRAQLGDADYLYMETRLHSDIRREEKYLNRGNIFFERGAWHDMSYIFRHKGRKKVGRKNYPPTTPHVFYDPTTKIVPLDLQDSHISNLAYVSPSRPPRERSEVMMHRSFEDAREALTNKTIARQESVQEFLNNWTGGPEKPV